MPLAAMSGSGWPASYGHDEDGQATSVADAAGTTSYDGAVVRV